MEQFERLISNAHANFENQSNVGAEIVVECASETMVPSSIVIANDRRVLGSQVNGRLLNCLGSTTTLNYPRYVP